MKLIKQIKIRVGEPLTAVALHSKGVLFGSISGYIGYFSYDTQKVFYLKDIYEELIRCITFQDDTTAYVSVGDLTGLVLNVSEPDKIECEQVEYDKRTHISSQCSSTIPFLHKQICLLVPFPSTNNKESQIESAGPRGSSWVINYKDGSMMDLGLINISSQAVPFDFDGQKLLWLEFHELKHKTMVTYDIKDLKLEKLHDFPHAMGVEFISHVKWYRGKLVMVQNHKKVVIFDPADGKSTLLYEHKSQIVGLAIYQHKSGQKGEPPVENKEISIEIKSEEESKEPQEKSAPLGSDLTIVTFDHSETLCLYEGNKPIQSTKIKQIPGFPEIPSNHYLFDMGYPYYVCMDGTHIAFTSDLGLFIMQYN